MIDIYFFSRIIIWFLSNRVVLLNNGNIVIDLLKQSDHLTSFYCLDGKKDNFHDSLNEIKNFQMNNKSY